MADLAQKLEPVARALLEPGETLTGCCAATWQRTFSGRMVAVVVSPTRLIIQPLDRRFAPLGDPISLTPDRIRHADVRNGVGGSVTIPSIIMDAVSITVDLTTTEGQRIKLFLTGSGGQVQHTGITALLAALDRPATGG